MSIISTFGELFDKTLSPAFANYTASNDAFEVDEHDPNPSITTRHLRVEQTGAVFASFNYMLVKGMDDITKKRSGLLEDHDCDGVAIKTYLGQDGLVFSELKSKFSTQKVYEAFQQMTHSFLKMHAMLSLCKDYALDDVSLHFIAACQCFEDKDQEVGIYNRLCKEEQVGKNTFVGKFMRRLIEKHELIVKFSEVANVWNLPLHQTLVDKEIKLTLQMTQNYGDSSVVYIY